MNPSEMENIWNKQKAIELTGENIAKVAAAVCAVDQKFRRTIWWRDLREIGAALIMAALVGLTGQTWLRWIAAASCLFVTGVIIWSRIAVRERSREVSVVDQVQQMIRETEMQIQLGRSVLWWYLLPCTVGIAAVALDRALATGRLSRELDPVNLAFFVVTVGAVYGVIYWLNQRAVRKQLEPRRARLRNMLADLRQ